MKLIQTILISIALFTTTAAIAHEGSHDHPELTMIMNKDLSNIPGKEVIMLTVNYKPGEIETPHKHEAQAFVYVLEGEIVMAVKGGKELTLGAGQASMKALKIFTLWAVTPAKQNLQNSWYYC
ncbi:cupin domain-containing protein [Methylophilus sp. Leaf408]|uniref:cupin domain-containing protein n=1 Tax=Methylophilus sp. Leaf408 TaxID=2876561 RepID=UPI001E28E6AA|nr:cupin domain-containing protein [Methylophilus sp. Leaf408]